LYVWSILIFVCKPYSLHFSFMFVCIESLWGCFTNIWQSLFVLKFLAYLRRVRIFLSFIPLFYSFQNLIIHQMALTMSCIMKHTLTLTSVNLAHNAPVELGGGGGGGGAGGGGGGRGGGGAQIAPFVVPPARPPPPPPFPARAGPPPISWVIIVCLSVRTMLGNCPDKQTDKHHCSFNI
jgi:hypothetical protein